ncbi:acyltransferase-domain-containing protein [Desarmillaria tabescens]|uniref:Acyltransferase-domain-containing protein n=1 Tax=Armillaria tabescens TaxID=1929756 RepID=A0AA39NGT4_ARMTA|nr:acyltransferase-domain-containing protein [Desarmillaria tabescens]KAK0465370.1 acyltransferase-domain-containing protein [Desarmillaria tabescens]
MTVVAPLYTLPISERPRQPWRRTFSAVLFFLVFNLGCLMDNASQFVFLLPLRLLPFGWSRALYVDGIRYTKGAFGCLLILMCQWFAPTKLIVSFETTGMGCFTPEDIDRIVVKDKKGDVVSLNLPTKFVMIANHQIYLDWLYEWCLLYFIGPQGVHRYVYITLKKSLQWIPVVGWGMQFFNFIFLARSWASDRVQLSASLSALGSEAEKQDNPLAFILYPEGTLVSQDTRPISKKFADKMGIADMTHTLLPRSTGLHYSLRSLSPRIPDLRLIDVTVVYPGIPPLHYGQDFYTLRSVFFDGIPPPVIHMHLRMFDVAREVPIGDLSGSNPGVSPKTEPMVEVDIPEREKKGFDEWLKGLWKEKDDSIGMFYEANSFAREKVAQVEIPLKLRRKREMLDAFCFFLPAAVGWAWGKCKRY